MLSIVKDKVAILHTETSLDIPADRVLESAIGKLGSVVLMGYDKDGNRYFASSIADGGEVLWLMDHCRLDLLEISR